MSRDIEGRFDELERITVPRGDESAVLQRGRKIRRRYRAKIAGILCLTLLAAGFAMTRVDLTSSPDLAPAEDPLYEDSVNGFTADLPEGWFGFRRESGGDPAEIATFASFPIQGDDYGKVCGKALSGMRYVAPNEAVIDISERYYSPETGGRIEREFPPRPTDIGERDARLYPYGESFYKEGCPATENEWLQVDFHDQGRGFYVSLQLGSELTSEEREEVWEFLDSFSFESRDGFPENSSYQRYEDDEAGFSIVYPKAWHRAEGSLTPNLSDPVELFSVASFPLEYRETDCANMPKSAFEDMGSADVFVSVQERFVTGGGTGDFRERPRSFRHSKPFVLECVPETLSSYWVRFEDGGRFFYALAVFGPETSLGVKDEAWAVLDSFVPEPIEDTNDEVSGCFSDDRSGEYPRLTLKPNHGPVGTKIKLLGECFEPTKKLRRDVFFIRAFSKPMECELLASSDARLRIRADGSARGSMTVPENGPCSQQDYGRSVTPGRYGINAGCHACDTGAVFRVTGKK